MSCVFRAFQYVVDVIYGTNVKALAVCLYSEWVMSNDRIAAFLNAASDGELGLSEGSVYGFCKKLAEAAGTSIRHLEDELLNRKVVATDATVITVNGEQNYIRNFSTGQTVVYHAILSDGREENKKIRHKYAKKDELALLNRMDRYSHNHLLFLRDIAVPFDDNLSERELRRAKNRQKMAGVSERTVGMASLRHPFS